MSVEIIENIEEAEKIKSDNKFLTPTVGTIRRSNRSVLNVVSVGLFVLIAITLGAKDMLAGLFFVPVSFLILICTIVGFCRAGKYSGDFGLNVQKASFLISTIALVVFATLRWFEIDLKYFTFLENIGNNLPKPFGDIVNVGIFGVERLAILVLVCFLFLSFSFNSQNKARKRNFPFTKTVLTAFIINILLTVALALDGVARLGFLPSDYTGGTDALAEYIDAGICFALAVFALLQAIRLLITYTRMRKVKNAVLKA